MITEAAFAHVERLAQIWDAQARTTEGGQGIPVGAGEIDYRWKADAIRGFVRRVRQGAPINEAANDATNEARSWVLRHNSRRNDINWQRWTGCVDGAIQDAARILRQGEC